MFTWFSRHGHALVSSAGHLARSPLATLLTVVVMSLALALPLALGTFVRNLQLATGDFSGAVGLTVYFKAAITEEQARALANKAKARRGVADAVLTTAAQGLEELREQSGFGAALDALASNPLPHVLTVTASGVSSTPAAIQTLHDYLTSWPEVETVQADREWVQRFDALLGALRRVLQIAVLLLGAGVIAVVGNTIRLEILNRRAEIEVTKLVGGTNGFVRRPFLYTGAWYGLVAGLVSWLIVAGALLALRAPAGRLASAYGSQFVLVPPTARELGWLLATGMALGLLGAWVACARHLASIEPRS